MTKSEASGCTVGIALGLCTLGISVAGVFFISRMLRGTADPDSIAHEVFVENRVPFGLVSADATDFLGQSGAVVARFILPEAPSTSAELESTEVEDRVGVATQTVEINPDPIELILVQFHESENLRKLFMSPLRSPRSSGDDESEMGASERLQKWEDEPDFEWRTRVMRDQVRWDGWETDFQIHRSFTDEGTWSDSARINVGVGDRHLAVFARWPDGVQVVREHVRSVARTIRMDLVADS